MQLVVLVILSLHCKIISGSSTDDRHDDQPDFILEPANGSMTLYPNEQKFLSLYVDGRTGENDSFRSTITVTYRDGSTRSILSYMFNKKGLHHNFQQNVTYEESSWGSSGSMLYEVAVTSGEHSWNVSNVTVEISFFRNEERRKFFRFEVMFYDATPMTSTITQPSLTTTLSSSTLTHTEAKSTEDETRTVNLGNQTGNEAKSREIGLTAVLACLLGASLVAILVLSICLIKIRYCPGNRNNYDDVESPDEANTSTANEGRNFEKEKN